MHVNWVEADRVLSEIYVLTEGCKTIGFIFWPSVMLGIDDISCVTVVTTIAIVAS